MRVRESLLATAAAATAAGFVLPALVFSNLLGLPLRGLLLEVSLADVAAGETVDVQVHDTYVLVGGGALMWVARLLGAAVLSAIAFVIARRPVAALVTCAAAVACALWLLLGLAPPEGDALLSSGTEEGSWTLYAPLSAYEPPEPRIERGNAAWALLAGGLVLLALAA